MKKNTAPKGIKIKMSREEIAYQIFIAVVVGLLVLCCLIPFLYVVGMSFTSEGEMIQRNFFVIIPQKPILAAYEYLLKNKDFFSGMGITIIRTAMGVCTALILTVPVGYILAIGDLPKKRHHGIFHHDHGTERRNHPDLHSVQRPASSEFLLGIHRSEPGKYLWYSGVQTLCGRYPDGYHGIRTAGRSK